MKNLVLIIVTFCLFGMPVNAALVPNGDFESTEGTAAGWDVWAGGGTVNAAESTTGGNPDGYVSLNAALGTWAGWYRPIPLPLAVLGVPAGETITLQADIKNISGALNAAGLKLEGKGGTPTEFGQLKTVTKNWATYSVELTTDPTNTGLIFSLMNIPADVGAASMNGYDNAQLIVGGKALFPVPTLGAFLPDDSTALTWVNPDPNNPADTVTAAAYLLQSNVPLSDPNLGPDVFEPGVVALAVTGESADVTGLLLAGKYYYWAVHVTDSNGGNPITTQGFTWNFIASGDSIPTVNAGADQYLVTEGSPMILGLGAVVVDDEDAGPVTITWTDLTNPADKNPNTTVTINSLGAENTTVTLANTVDGAVTGYYIFQITVDDSVNDPVIDQVIVNVLETCGQAADADPNDDYDITGDLNLDCKKDLADFAIFAAAWLDCNTNRPGDVTCP